MYLGNFNYSWNLGSLQSFPFLQTHSLGSCFNINFLRAFIATSPLLTSYCMLLLCSHFLHHSNSNVIFIIFDCCKLWCQQCCLNNFFPMVQLSMLKRFLANKANYISYSCSVWYSQDQFEILPLWCYQDYNLVVSSLIMMIKNRLFGSSFPSVSVTITCNENHGASICIIWSFLSDWPLKALVFITSPSNVPAISTSSFSVKLDLSIESPFVPNICSKWNGTINTCYHCTMGIICTPNETFAS